MKKVFFYALVAVLLCSCGATQQDYVNWGNGFKQRGEYEKAKEYYKKAAIIYEKNKNLSSAIYYYELADDTTKTIELSLQYAIHFENKRDYENAAKYYQKAKNTAKVNEMHLKLAQDYEGKQDYEKAISCYEKLGDTAKVNEMYLKLAQDYESKHKNQKAVLYYEKLGDTAKVNEMYLKLAQSYERTQDYEKAISYYEKLGNVTKINEMYLHIAQKQFANSDINSVSNGIDICKNINNDNIYRQCISKGAAKQADICSNEVMKRAKNHKNGDGVSCSNAGALYNYYLNDISNSLFYHYFAYNMDDRHNLDSFVQVLEKSCVKGGKNDCFMLGWIQSNENGYINYQKAIQAYTKACNLNHYTACNNLGALYQKSYAVKLIDNKKSFELYTKACKGGNMVACSNIGGMYEKGRVVTRSFNAAKSYYKKACVGGYEKACGFYNNLEANVTNIDNSDSSQIYLR